MLWYLLVALLFLEYCFSQTIITNCDIQNQNNVWKPPPNAIYDCVIKSAVENEPQALDIEVDTMVEFKQNIGDANYPILNLRILSKTSSPVIVKVAGDILTDGDQNFEVGLDFTSSGDQLLNAGGIINIAEDSTKSSTGQLQVKTTNLGMISVKKSLTVAENLVLDGQSLQFHGPSLASGGGNIDLIGEFLFMGNTAQLITCPNGILSAKSFNKDSSLTGKVTLEAKPIIGDGSTAAGIRLSDPGGIIIQTSGASSGLEIKSPITTPGEIGSGGDLTLSHIQLTGAPTTGQLITSEGSLVTGDITQTEKLASLTLTGKNGITTGDIRVPGTFTVHSSSSIKMLVGGQAIFQQSMTISGDVTTELGFSCIGDVTLTGSGTQTIDGGDTLEISGNINRKTGDLTLKGTHITANGNVNVEAGSLRVDAVGQEPHSQMQRDITATGITFAGSALLSSSSTQTLDAGTGDLKIQTGMSKESGDLIIMATNFDVVGDLTANSGSLTIAGTATSFRSTGNILAGLDLNLPACELKLQGNTDQSVTASMRQTTGTLQAPNQITKSNNGPLNLQGVNVNLEADVHVAGAGLTIIGNVNAKGNLIAAGGVDVDKGQLVGNVEGRDITIGKTGQINLVGTSLQKLESPTGTVNCQNRMTKQMGDLLIFGASSVSLLNDITVTTGNLEIRSNAQATVQGNMIADTMTICTLLLQGSFQNIRANSITASAMTKTTPGDVTIEVSAMLRLTGLWVTLHSTTSMLFQKKSLSDQVVFSSENNIRSEKDITIKYPILLDGIQSEQVIESTSGSVKCKEIKKKNTNCRILGPNGIEIIADSIAGFTGIDIAGSLTITGSLTTDVEMITATDFVLQGSGSLTRADTQQIKAASLTLGVSMSVGGLTKANGNLNIELNDNIIIHGDVSVANGVFDVMGSTASIYSTIVEASSINFHGFSENVINLLGEPAASRNDQTLFATEGQLKLDGQLTKQIGKLELKASDKIIILGSSIIAGELLVSSPLQTKVASIKVNGKSEFKDDLELQYESKTEISIDELYTDIDVIFRKKISKNKGQLAVTNRLGKTYFYGDVTLGDGSFDCSSKVFIFGTVVAPMSMTFQQTVMLQGVGNQALTSKNIKFQGEKAVSVTKSDGDLSLGDSVVTQTTILFDGVASLSVWNGSLTVYGKLTIGHNIWADHDITLQDVTMNGASQQQQIIALGCLRINGVLKKPSYDLMLGQDCIELGTQTETSNGDMYRCGPTSKDPCETKSCKCRTDTLCRTRPFSCPEPENRPTASPIKAPTAKATPAPTIRKTLEPTKMPTTKPPTRTGETFAPTASPIRISAPTPQSEKAESGGGGLSAAAIVGIIVVVLAIPGIAILIWLCLRNRSSGFGDRQVLLSEDVGEYRAPNA